MRTLSSRFRQGTTAVRLAIETLEDRSLLSGTSYFVIGAVEAGLPNHLAQNIRAVGGVLTNAVPQIGVATAESTDPAFATRAAHIPGIRSVVPTAILTDRETGPAGNHHPRPAGPPVTPDELSSVQWALDAIDAPQAWSLGASGQGVRVAILDTGIISSHPDLRANINRDLSVFLGSGLPGETWEFVPTEANGGFSHATHVAGVIAAADDDRGIVGVAPRAELVAIKVWSDYTSVQHKPEDIAAVIRGIVYAADIRADVLNMSLSYTLDPHGFHEDPEGTPDDPSDDFVMTPKQVAEVTRAFQRATDYAHRKGVTMVAAAGNQAIDGDRDGDLITLPRDLPHVISVSATGPQGWIKDPTTNPDKPAIYTNYGKSVIDLAAPGGNIDPGLAASGELVTVLGVTVPAFLFDGLLSTNSDPFPVEHPDLHVNFGLGTSFATPHVAAVAALVIEAIGHRTDPDAVFSLLMKSADDLGEPGKDAFYGHGRVNAFRAVSLALPARKHGLRPLAPASFHTSTIAVVGAGRDLFSERLTRVGQRPILNHLAPLDAANPAIRLTQAVALYPDSPVIGHTMNWSWTDDLLDSLDIYPIDVRN